MNNAFVIEAAGEAAGLVVRERRGFRFFASAPQFAALEQRLFRRSEDAARAAVRSRATTTAQPRSGGKS